MKRRDLLALGAAASCPLGWCAQQGRNNASRAPPPASNGSTPASCNKRTASSWVRALCGAEDVVRLRGGWCSTMGSASRRAWRHRCACPMAETVARMDREEVATDDRTSEFRIHPLSSRGTTSSSLTGSVASRKPGRQGQPKHGTTRERTHSICADSHSPTARRSTSPNKSRLLRSPRVMKQSAFTKSTSLGPGVEIAIMRTIPRRLLRKTLYLLMSLYHIKIIKKTATKWPGGYGLLCSGM